MAAFAGAMALASPQGKAPAKVTAVIDASRTGPPISPYFYGQFLENLGTTINGSLWAEMIDDRKFFYPVDSSEKLVPPNSRRWNRWRPVGPDAAVVMDRKSPYVGDHSPVVLLDPSAPRGIVQSGIPLAKGRGYTGRVVLAGGPGITVDPSELIFSAMTNMSLTDFSSGLGGLDQAKGAALEQIVIDSDIWQSVKEVRSDVKFDKEHFAADLIESVGPGGNFLGTPHTIRNMRKELFLPDKDRAELFESYRLANDQREIVMRARERVKKVLSTHRADPIDASVVRTVDEIVAGRYH